MDYTEQDRAMEEEKKKVKKVEKVSEVSKVRKDSPFLDNEGKRNKRGLRYIEEEDRKMFPPIPPGTEVDFIKMYDKEIDERVEKMKKKQEEKKQEEENEQKEEEEKKEEENSEANNQPSDKEEPADTAQALYQMEMQKSAFKRSLIVKPEPLEKKENVKENEEVEKNKNTNGNGENGDEENGDGEYDDY